MVGGNVLQPSVVWCRCPSSFWVVMYICFASLNMVIELNLIMFLHLFFSWRGTSITTEKWREEGRIDQKKKARLMRGEEKTYTISMGKRSSIGRETKVTSARFLLEEGNHRHEKEGGGESLVPPSGSSFGWRCLRLLLWVAVLSSSSSSFGRKCFLRLLVSSGGVVHTSSFRAGADVSPHCVGGGAAAVPSL